MRRRLRAKLRIEDESGKKLMEFKDELKKLDDWLEEVRKKFTYK